MKPQVSERSIDDIFARTLETNRLAAQTVLAAAAPSNALLSFDRVTVVQQARHLNVHGTADLVLKYWQNDTLQGLILIENKIDAGFTRDQPERYCRCRNAHIVARSAPVIATLLVSPAIYIAGSRLKEAFDGTLTYESLLPFVSEADRATLEMAIERASSPYEPVADAAVMGFFNGYKAIAAEAYQDLQIKPNPNSANARPEKSRTIYFDARASGFRRYTFLLKDGKPASISASHQCWDSAAPSASIKLMVGGWARHIKTVAPIIEPAFRGTGIYLRPAAKSLAFVADTKRLDNKRSAFDQRESIEAALTSLRRIRNLWNGLEAVLGRASSELMQ